MLTIDDLIHTTLTPEATVVAGAEHLGVDVSWAVALRSRPPAFEGLKGGELAIVSLATMHQLDDRLTLARLIEQIAGFGVAAVAVIGTVDEEARRAAARLGLPVIQLPETVSARDLEGRVTRAIVERRAELQRIGHDLYHQLLELVVAGRGAEAVVAKLAELTGRPAILQDAALNLLAVRFPPGANPNADLAAIVAGQRGGEVARLLALGANASDPPTVRLPLPVEGLARVVAPIGGAQGRDGYLSIVGTPAELGPFERLAVSRAAAACAIDYARERAARSDSDLRLAELLDELLSGSYPSEAAIVSRAHRLGCDLTAPHRALAVRGVDAEGLPTVRPLERLVRRELARRGLSVALRLDATGALLLLPATLSPEAVQLFVVQLREGLVGFGGHLAAALSRPASGPHEIRQALQIAQRTLDYAIRAHGPDAWCVVSELGADELLLSLGPSPLLRAFRDDWLERLAAYDRRHKTQLVQTLAVYFDAHGSPTEAAERLHLHRNTLLYRLQRIREITGRDPDDPRARLAFHLALRIDHVLGQA
ncbi:MAG: helix-turn-helix domain-containing protein [Chloroflexota bacterium]|nr:helix-turn-helix domain-containing protein [Dehalococcoidia bacterium]MDW8254956.1 helix-turn-helix domain-containing protein [Chloroflexota bacterium]